MRTALTISPTYPDRDEADISGGPGDYQCVVVLGPPGDAEYLANIDIQVFMDSGASLLTIPPLSSAIAMDLVIQGSPYRVIFEGNKRREAARARSTLRAENMLVAEQLCHDNILPLVSWLAFDYDVGVSIRGWVITELTTGLQRVRVGLLGASRQLRLATSSAELTEDTRSLFASFREGSASANVFFQALCYWKVVEGVYAIRTRDMQPMVSRGEAPRRTPECIPQALAGIPYVDKWALAGFAPYLGTKFTSVRDDLRKRLRNPLAHLLPDHATIPRLSADVFKDVNTCEEVVPVLRYMARTLIQAHLEESCK